MRILIIGATYFPQNNGQSIFTSNLAEGMARMGNEVMVLTPGTGEKQERVKVNGVTKVLTRALNLAFIHKEFFLSFGYQGQVKKIFREFQPEVVHLQDSAPVSQYAQRVARSYGIPVVTTHHPGPDVGAPYFTNMPNPFRKWIEFVIWRWILHFLNKSDLVVTPSASAARMLLEHGLKVDVRPISCGVNLQDFNETPNDCHNALLQRYGLPVDRKIFLYVGRMDYEKRVDVIIKAIADVHQNDVLLALAGKGAREEEIKRLAHRLQVEERVLFLGEVSHTQVPGLMNCANVFVMPGDGELLSIATLEAMACGKPVLAANAMALPELVKNGLNGLLFEPGNPKDAARKMEMLAGHTEIWRQMGDASKQRVARHDTHIMLLAYEALYRNASSRSKKARKIRPARRRVIPQRSTLEEIQWKIILPVVRYFQVVLLFILILMASVMIYGHTTAAPVALEHLKTTQLYSKISEFKDFKW